MLEMMMFVMRMTMKMKIIMVIALTVLIIITYKHYFLLLKYHDHRSCYHEINHHITTNPDVKKKAESMTQKA